MKQLLVYGMEQTGSLYLLDRRDDMIAKYNDKYYYCAYYKEDNQTFISTSNKEKVLEGFSVNRSGRYGREISFEELDDAFEVDYRVIYHSGIPNQPIEWPSATESYNIDGEHIKIFQQGLLPGWDWVDRGVCSKTLEKEEVEGAKIIKTYYRKDGVTMDPPLTIIEETDAEGLLKAQVGFLQENL